MSTEVIDRSSIPPEVQREIETFAAEVERLRLGQVSEEQFRHFRLQHGIYGQRQPGYQMVRVKIPSGTLRAVHLERLADIADDYSTGIGHVTTRQDFQFHWVKLDNVPEIMWRLAEVGVTTREACGNTIRNVTACPLSGVCQDEVFDVTPYARATTYHFLRNPVCQQLGRKFKISFSGCQERACALAHMHDIGSIAAVREENGVKRWGFEVYVGGGLGPAPHQAKLFSEFVPVEEMLPVLEAIVRVFNRLGERRNRNKARMKFLVAKLGIEEFRRLVLEERKMVNVDPMKNTYFAAAEDVESPPEIPPVVTGPNGHHLSHEFLEWKRTNVTPQRQEGYVIATIALPLGDITSDQFRALARIARQFVGDNIRTTVQQNLILRWVREKDLPALYYALSEVGLGEPNAGTIIDVTACPGADTCNLGITSSRGLARAIRRELMEGGDEIPEEIRGIKIKISGCPNSCGQHHIANIGFFGSSIRVGEHVSPHYQLVLGGQAEQNAIAYGSATVKVPAKNIPAVVRRLTEVYRSEREPGESFNDCVGRLGKEEIRKRLADFLDVPEYHEVPDHYVDWGQEGEFSLKGIGTGECAGEMIGIVQLKFEESNRQIFEANLLVEKGRYVDAIDRTEGAMISAAQALIATRGVPQEVELQSTDRILSTFEEGFIKTGLISPIFSGWAHRAEHVDESRPTKDLARLRLEEAVLFIEECQSAYSRMRIEPVVSGTETRA
jgi:sulfite reductase (ferredoxin)